MEAAATAHLKRIGAWLAPVFRDVPPSNHPFPVEASVVIPVRNRVRTVADAVKSALAQRTDFPFNVIVVDNHSTDGTTAILADLAGRHPALKHIIPGTARPLHRRLLERGDLFRSLRPVRRPARFGRPLPGRRCPPAARRSAAAGKLCAWSSAPTPSSTAICGEIPPGLIDHREWTDENGRNNALRINGLGAPRAFNTAILRRIGFPNVGYGEDYAVGPPPVAGIPDRPDLRQPLPLPPLGGEHGRRPFHRAGEPPRRLQGPAPDDRDPGAPKTERGEGMEILIIDR